MRGATEASVAVIFLLSLEAVFSMRTRSNRPRRIIIMLTVILVMSGAYAAWGLYTMSQWEEPVAEASFHGFLMDPPAPAPKFELIDQHYQPFRLADHNGKLVVIFFGYTNCPDVCPATLVYYTQVKRALGPLADQVEFVFITVDPEYDTPEHLRAYVERFDPAFYGLTGDEETIRELALAYGVYYDKVEDESSPVGYWVEHTAFTFVVDTDGNLRLVHPFGVESEDIASDLRQLL